MSAEINFHSIACTGSVDELEKNIQKLKLKYTFGDMNSIVNIHGFNILHCASFYGNIPIITYILENKLIDINSFSCLDQGVSGKATPLHYAISGGNREAVEILMEFGSDPYLKDWKGVDCIKLSNMFGNKKIVEIVTRQIDQDGKNH